MWNFFNDDFFLTNSYESSFEIVQKAYQNIEDEEFLKHISEQH